MTVSGVNNANSNAGIYTTGAAVIGGVAGTAYGYLSKPFVAKDDVPTDSFIRKIIDIHTPGGRKAINNLFKAKSIEELKNIYLKFKLIDANKVDELFADKSISIDEVKNELKAKYIDAINERKKDFADYWDYTKKTFKECEDDYGKAFKKAAQCIQRKHAAIYGAIGAAVLGLGTYLATKKKETPEA